MKILYHRSYHQYMKCEYNVTPIPRMQRVKKQDDVEGVKVAERLRKQTARSKIAATKATDCMYL